MTMTAPATILDINDDVVTEILLRLSSATVLRARAVCKAWHRITTSADFVAGHARRRPLELILQRYGPSPSGALETIPLDTLDEARRRCLPVQFPADRYTRPKGAFRSGYALIASCDGLLMFERALSGGGGGGEDLLVCNPVTRQWAVVPRPPCTFVVPCGFYVHKPSSEHRVLCLTDDQQGSHYVCSLEAAEARRLGSAVPSLSLCVDLPLHYVNYRGGLHWSLYPRVIFPMDNGQCPNAEEKGKIVVFDTESETFRRTPRPPGRSHGYSGEAFVLLEVDRMLAMADFLDGSMDLWVLEDYSNGASWTLRLRVDLPSPWRYACWAMVSPSMEGQNVLLLGDRGRSWLGLYDVTEKRVLKQIKLVDDPWSIRVHVFIFRDSLERHAFFDLHGPQTPDLH